MQYGSNAANNKLILVYGAKISKKLAAPNQTFRLLHFAGGYFLNLVEKPVLLHKINLTFPQTVPP
jgi:hypothetical protein